MNTIVARMLGEADYHSPEERAVLGQGQHDETGSAAEETRDVQLANRIVAAAKAGKNEQVIQLAQQLIKMHRPKPTDRTGQVGYTTPNDFQSGRPFRFGPKGQPFLRNARPLE